MKIESTAFENGGSIPQKFTCDGEDVSPALRFIDVPKGAKSLALIVDDPDVPPSVRADRNWDHWIVWNIPPGSNEVAEGGDPHGTQGRNSWGKNRYGGPCPPDREHRYFFRLFALDRELVIPQSAGKAELLAAMKGHIIEEAQLVGRYDRPRR